MEEAEDEGGRERVGGGGGGTLGIVAVGTLREELSPSGGKEGLDDGEGEGERGGGGGAFRAAELGRDGRFLPGGGGPGLVTRRPPEGLLMLEVTDSLGSLTSRTGGDGGWEGVLEAPEGGLTVL